MMFPWLPDCVYSLDKCAHSVDSSFLGFPPTLCQVEDGSGNDGRVLHAIVSTFFSEKWIFYLVLVNPAFIVRMNARHCEPTLFVYAEQDFRICLLTFNFKL